jgi:hypothetical protein
MKTLLLGCLLLSGCMSLLGKPYAEMTPEQIQALKDMGFDVYACFVIAGPPPSGKFVYVTTPHLDQKADIRFGENCQIR